MKTINILKVLLLTVFLVFPAFSGAIAQESEMMAPESETMAPEKSMEATQGAEAMAPESMEMTQAEEPANMTISRFVTCQAVENHEPTGITNTFPADTEKAYAFLEATKISADVKVEFVWLHNDKETARVPVSIREGSRWRTYSSKKLAGRTGKWQVEIQDQTGAVLASLDFTVE